MSLCRYTSYTAIIWIVASATINFSLAQVRLLFEGGSCSRAAIIILDDVGHTRKEYEVDDRSIDKWET